MAGTEGRKEAGFKAESYRERGQGIIPNVPGSRAGFRLFFEGTSAPYRAVTLLYLTYLTCNNTEAVVDF